MEENKDWKGNSNSIWKTGGFSNHTDKERQNEDYYATSPEAAEWLLKIEDFRFIKNIYEPSCGEGHLSKVFEKNGFNVISTDLIDRGYGQGGIDFFDVDKQFIIDNNIQAIITNPPYSLAQKFVEHALDIIGNGKVMMFLKLQFLEGKSRRKLFDRGVLDTLYVSSSRIMCAKNGDFETMIKGGGSAIAYGWYCFSNTYTIPQIKFFN